jgi:hypothetical protein
MKRFIFLSWHAIVLYSCLEIFYLHPLNEFHVRSYLLFCVSSLLCGTLYILRIEHKEFHSLRTDPIFWLFAGSFCFYSVFIINLLTMLDTQYWFQPKAKLIFHILQSVATIIYYLFICIAFITSYYRQAPQAM